MIILANKVKEWTNFFKFHVLANIKNSVIIRRCITGGGHVQNSVAIDLAVFVMSNKPNGLIETLYITDGDLSYSKTD